MQNHLKFKGWLLSYTVIILAISSLMMMALIFVFHQKQFWYQNGLNSFHHDLIHLNNIKKAEHKFLPTQGWGFYRILPSWSEYQGDSTFQSALLGTCYPKSTPILILKKSAYPLKVSGSIYLKGSLTIPFQAIERKLKTVQPSNINLEIDSIHISSHKDQSAPMFNTPDPMTIEYFEHAKTSNYNSFRHPTKVLEFDNYTIKDSLVGNIMVRANGTLIIAKSAYLNNVIIDAPKVVIQEGFKGSLHINTNQLIVNQNISLTYPSSININLINDKTLFLPQTFELNGALVINSTTQTSIEINGKINGLVHCNSPIQISGNHSGQIICPKIRYQTNASTSTNLIANTSITDFIQQNSIPFPVSNNKQKLNFIKWLE